jgi:hypothetical protein
MTRAKVTKITKAMGVIHLFLLHIDQNGEFTLKTDGRAFQ